MLLTSWVCSLDIKLTSLEEGNGILGDPFTDAVFEATQGKEWKSFRDESIQQLDQQNVIKEQPFEAKTKFSSKERIHPINEKIHQIFFKGAPEILLNQSKFIFHKGNREELGEGLKIKLNQALEEMTNQGLRVIGFALEETNIEGKAFIGMMAFEDSIRDVSKEIQACQKAGIKVKVIHKKFLFIN